ncbi:hypothetical protein KIH86_11290 [Paenibacillus sp. HN-1]|uniref:hypothetical protein n=1 Tax=Paenibacillus TaxID=44249 RepID=UPI001CA926A6|nr:MULTISPECIES: hypothetical protein [Paenibacillus]MBY9082446.1 hypothetical protein [Paenibacillus sp. CGMCC 1.18879]MBY9084805.1 hypothetical protein [Paenibacillus sinensis]
MIQSNSVDNSSCTCKHFPISTGAVNRTNENQPSFSQYLAPLLSGMISPFGIQSQDSSSSLSSMLPFTGYSSYMPQLASQSDSLNGSTMALLALLLGAGSSAYMQPYYGYRNTSTLGYLQPGTSRIDLKR